MWLVMGSSEDVSTEQASPDWDLIIHHTMAELEKEAEARSQLQQRSSKLSGMMLEFSSAAAQHRLCLR